MAGGDEQAGAAPRRRLIGGIGYRWMRDASFGLLAVDALARRERPPHVDVADLGYGAIYAAQDIAAAQPPYRRIVLVAGVERGHAPGTLLGRRWQPEPCSPEELQARMREAGAGVIDVDHLLHIGSYFDAWPDDVLLIEFEPLDTGSGDGLSAAAALALEEAVDLALSAATADVAAAGSPAG